MRRETKGAGNVLPATSMVGTPRKYLRGRGGYRSGPDAPDASESRQTLIPYWAANWTFLLSLTMGRCWRHSRRRLSPERLPQWKMTVAQLHLTSPPAEARRFFAFYAGRQAFLRGTSYSLSQHFGGLSFRPRFRAPHSQSLRRTASRSSEPSGTKAHARAEGRVSENARAGSFDSMNDLAGSTASVRLYNRVNGTDLDRRKTHPPIVLSGSPTEHLVGAACPVLLEHTRPSPRAPHRLVLQLAGGVPPPLRCSPSWLMSPNQQKRRARGFERGLNVALAFSPRKIPTLTGSHPLA